ncbi:MAG: hypothetical protein LBN29_04505 [Mediterranea sp.]|jgi:hypothetical protein|nr:hypothetical protein [Mediterranea sp.]
MKIDIFSTTCFEYRTDSFGLYDDEEEGKQKNPAIIVPIEDERCIARVKNTSGREICFVPLDKNISYNKANGETASLCDVLLIVIRTERRYDFCLVELKNKQKDWITDGIEQLKSTIGILRYSYSVSSLSKRMAYLSNKKHPYFHHSHKDVMERFRKETGFRLNITAEITIK